jgi:superfamily II DNA or RNA helicase
MKAIVKGEIQVPKHNISKEMLQAYTYKQKIFGRDYEKTIRNYRKDKDFYYFPRDLTKFRKHLNTPFEYHTSQGRSISFEMKFKPLSHQVEPINDIVSAFKGRLNVLFKAPTRFGKTFSVVSIINKLKTNALIIVDKKLLVEQFVEDTYEYSTATISELTAKTIKEYSKLSDIYITTFQFLHSNPLLLNKIKDDFGIVVVDECHSLVADTYRKVLYSVNSRYRLGVSATPTSKAHGLTPLITDSFEEVKVEGKYNGIEVDVYTYRLPRQYSLDMDKPISPQYTNYFLLQDTIYRIEDLLDSLKGYRVMLAIPNQTVQNRYADLAQSLGFKVGIMNSEPHNLKVKNETLDKFKEGELDLIVGLGQLMKGVSAPIEVIVDFFAVGNSEATEQLVGRARTVFEGRKCAKYIQLTSKYTTNKNDKVLKYLNNLDFTNFKGAL